MTLDKKVLTFLRESNYIEDVRDEDSVIDAVEAWSYIVTRSRLTIQNILRTHQILMRRQPLQKEEIGRFRTVPVYIGGREAIYPFLILELMQSWVNKANMSYTTIDVVRDHVQYEFIHPFIDGNGRTGRIFMNWQLQRLGKPITVIYEKDKQTYYQLFEDAKPKLPTESR